MRKVLTLLFFIFTTSTFVPAQETTVIFNPAKDTIVNHAEFRSISKGGVIITVERDSDKDNFFYTNNNTVYRCYAGHRIKLGCIKGNITKVELLCAGKGNSDYGPGCITKNSSTNGYTYSGEKGKWTGKASMVELYVNSVIGMKSIQVTCDSKQEETVKIGSFGYASFSSKCALDFNNTGVQAYFVKAVGDGIVELSEETIIPADHGMILKAPEGSYSIPVTLENIPANQMNFLISTAYGAVESDGSCYALGYKGSDIGFFNVPSGTLVNAKRAFLISDDGKAKTLLITDGVNNVAMERRTSAPNIVYNLAGQRVDESYKGIVIINGRKKVWR